MNDFEKAQEALARARGDEGAARLAVHLAAERLKRLAAQSKRGERTRRPAAPAPEVSRELEKSLGAARKDLDAKRAKLTAYVAAQKTAFDAFHAVAPEPRKGLGFFKVDYPFLLLPLRIETRFKDQSLEGNKGHFLWVRVYPDDCSIDTFEPVVAEAELRSLRSFWIAWWKAGGQEDLQRGAWRGLVASTGSGRAEWLIENYKPTGAAPAKAKKTDVVLVIATDVVPGDVPTASATEKSAIAKYWAAIWLADGSLVATTAARAALDAAVTAERATELIAVYVPDNLSDVPSAPLTKPDVALGVAFLDLPKRDDVPTQQTSWAQPARTYVLPDRLTVIGYVGNQIVIEHVGGPIPSPLDVAIDPSAPAEDQFPIVDGERVVPKTIAWVVDFREATKVGMGFEIDLDEAAKKSGIPDLATRGLDRLLVLGIRLASGESAGAELVETLLDHHRRGRTGFELLPQGTPTNNTDSGGTAFSRSNDDADTSFDSVFKTSPPAAPATGWFDKSDGQRLADALGIKANVLDRAGGSRGTDALEAQAMNAALWPATLGYTMHSQLQPVFDDETVDLTRWFFTHFVTGRGLLPAIRIGRQPYGILPSAPLSRLGWPSGDAVRLPGQLSPGGSEVLFIGRLAEVLRAMGEDWKGFSAAVPFVGKTGDPHRLLLEILGLHAGSVEYHQRFAENVEDLWNRARLMGFGAELLAALAAALYLESGMSVLQRLGYKGDVAPDVLTKLFLDNQQLLRGPVVDDRPLSESQAIRPYTADGRNYIEWLKDGLLQGIDAVRTESGFDGAAPTALLYILLRHAGLQAAWDASLRFHVSSAALEAAVAPLARREPAFVHVKAPEKQPLVGESRWSALYKVNPAITGNADQLVVDFLPSVIGQGRPEMRALDDVVEALDRLESLPTSRLERLFAEHVDVCSYRHDAWVQGLLHYRLASQRFPKDLGTGARPGLYLGAYGFIEDLRPEDKTSSPVTLPADLEKELNPRGVPALVADKTNGGFIHAPSMNHAVTAAVLRNGYISNATPDRPDALAVNLSSERVRRALAVLEGMRGGQSLGALLGYQFERGLHDRHDLAEVDEFIYPLRRVFPLTANRLKSTAVTDPSKPIEALEARNVVDGLQLAEHVRQRPKDQRAYPFGKDLPPARTQQQADAIDAEVDRLLDTHDAVADLMLAEGVHQAVQGNYDRAAAALDVVGKGHVPSEPDVVRTPRSGIGLTHRVALQLEVRVAPNASQLPAVANSPRGSAQPSLNKWLAGILPPPDAIVAIVDYTVAGATQTDSISQLDLEMQPIDLLYLIPAEGGQAMTELDDRIVRALRKKTGGLRSDAFIRIRYTERVENKVTFFELFPLLRSLRALLLGSRTLRPTDVMLPNEAKKGHDEATGVDKARLTGVVTDLGGLADDLAAFLSAGVLTDVDAGLDGALNLLASAARFGIPETGWGSLYDWRRSTSVAILLKVKAVAERWASRAEQFDAIVTEYDSLPAIAPNEVRNQLLRNAERLVSTTMTHPLPSAPADYRGIVGGKRVEFDAKLVDLNSVLTTPTKTVAGLLAEAKAQLPLAAFDLEELDFSETDGAIVRFLVDLSARLSKLKEDIAQRVAAATAQLTAHDTSSSAGDRQASLLEAAHGIFGSHFDLIPEFEMAPDRETEWQSAYEAGAHDGPLLAYLTGTLGRDEPVDDWLHGVARVREKMRHFEQVLLFTGAFSRPEPALRPAQLPYRPPAPPAAPGEPSIPRDHWLALEFPKDHTIDSDRLLYTAHYATPLLAGKHCGLLIDEWTEIIPAAAETTGLVFHYDRPSSEAPQAMLLVTSSEAGGAWQFDDLVDAIRETLDGAKKRAVEPAQVDGSGFARFLPATIMAVTLRQMTISANLAINIGFGAAIAKANPS